MPDGIGVGGEEREQLSSCLPPDDQFVGAVLYELLLDQSTWVHRRVETIEVLDEVSVGRRVSIDLTLGSDLEAFSPPGSETIGMLPLTMLKKRTLRNFDLRDGHGLPMPMLTKGDNARYAAASLIVNAEGILDTALPADLARCLREVVGERPPAENSAFQVLRNRADSPSDPRRAELRTLLDEESFFDHASALAENFVLLAAHELELDRRQLFKLSYEEPAGEVDGLDRTKRTLERLGWSRKGIVITVPTVSLSASFHLEVQAPPDLEIDAARLHFEAEKDGVEPPDDILDDDRERAHLYAPGLATGISAKAVIYLRHRRDGYLAAAFLTGLLITALLAAGLARITQISSPEESQTAATLLLVVPTILAAYIVRPGEHRLATRVLLGLRLFVMIEAACAIVATGLLAGGFSGPELECAWTADLAVSAAATIALLAGLMLPVATKR
jgi:hypothetical protein